ncbi:glutamyl-tRNA(Gln) amidotransferase subunit C, mitochondrial [Chelonus insularis]|uniref:glutamyl-tRNA(Gln) amidotransferase subunit C, mitochondrial n=1 Tax=Chelonus insularis TaxID=460826 RepID=UPI001589F010|nr:glutamyl-tRNA(Gln) amidotransferase subunit C, mitochondrial [Chelonus insularis]
MDFLRFTNHFILVKSGLKIILSQLRHQKTFNIQQNNLESAKNKIDKKTILKLERLALVGFGDEAGIKRLEAAIKFTEPLKTLRVNDSVKPMYNILENENLRLREDKVTEGDCRKKILKNATITEEEYFVAPPRNIPLEQ